MLAFELIRRYRLALAARDLNQINGLFLPSATVSTPESGSVPAADFHSRLFEKRKDAVTRLENVFDGLGKTVLALHFTYSWFLRTGQTLRLEGMSLFYFDEAMGKFSKLCLIYDPTELRRWLPQVDIAPFEACCT